MQPGDCFGLFSLLNKMHIIFFHLHSALLFFDESIVSFGIFGNTALELKITPPQLTGYLWLEIFLL